MFRRWKNASAPFQMSATFNLYRSYPIKCGDGVYVPPYDWLMCGSWMIPDTPIECMEGVDRFNYKAPWTLSSNSSWFTCNKYLRLPEGDEELTEEKKKWLKWRIYDLQERYNAESANVTQFVSAKLEIFNGIPVKS